jgi:hypothetical protein
MFEGRTLEEVRPEFRRYFQRAYLGVTAKEMPFIEGEPENGFYWMKHLGGKTVVAIISDPINPGRQICYIGPEKRETSALQIWRWLMGKHIKPELAKAIFDGGEWPGDVPDSSPETEVSAPATSGAAPLLPDESTPPLASGPVPSQLGHNSGEVPQTKSEGDLALEEVAAYRDRVLSFFANIKKRVTRAEDANAVDNYRDELQACVTRLKAIHRKEKEPHDKLVKAIDAKYLRPCDDIEETRRMLFSAVNIWKADEQKRRNAEAEEERKRMLALAEAKRQAELAAAMANNDVEAAADIAAAPIEVPEVKVERVLTGGQRGRRKGVQMEKVVAFTGPDGYLKAFMALRDRTDVREAIEAAVMKLHKAGTSVPGTEIKEVPKS